MQILKLEPSDFDIVKVIRGGRIAGCAVPLDGRDAELLRLCAETEFLIKEQHRCMAAINGDECMPFLEAIDAQLDVLKCKVLVRLPKTFEGYRTLARMTRLFQTPYLQTGEVGAADLNPDLVIALLTALAS